jgi:hypothetical protein
LGADSILVDAQKGCQVGNATRIVVVVVALFACDHRSSAPAAPVSANGTTIREAVGASAPVTLETQVNNIAAPGATFAAYATSSGDGWAVGVEMAKAVTRVVVLDERSFGKPLSLPAKPETTGGFEASAQGLRLRGQLDGATLKATIEAPTAYTFTAKRATPPATFAAIFGGAGLRVDWRQLNGKVIALLQRLEQPTRKLEGHVQGAVFALTQRDELGNIVARLDGALLSERAALARWTTREVSEPVTLDSAVVSLYPVPLELASGAKIVPVEEYATTGGCVTDSVFPRIANVPTDVALNKEISKQFRLPPAVHVSCVPAESWDATTYEITGHGRDWVSFEVQGYGYRGGAHGGGSSRCAIASLVEGKLESLAEELPQNSLKKLEALVRSSLLKQSSAKSIAALGFSGDDLMIDTSRPMCVRDDHGSLFLEVIYADDEGMFRLSAPPRARIPRVSVRGLFPTGTLGERIFR